VIGVAPEFQYDNASLESARGAELRCQMGAGRAGAIRKKRMLGMLARVTAVCNAICLLCQANPSHSQNLRAAWETQAMVWLSMLLPRSGMAR
jgi:hypothetical protein